MDENDNSPVFDITSDTSVDIAENTPMGEKVAVVLGRDRDAGSNGLVRMHLQRALTPAHLRCSLLRLILFEGTSEITSLTNVTKPRPLYTVLLNSKQFSRILRNRDKKCFVVLLEKKKIILKQQSKIK